MGVNYNPKIVTDGLVLYLDAANPKSYPGSGTTWYDLLGTNNGSILGSPSFSSQSIILDGVDDTVNGGNDASINFGEGNFTISLWAKRNTSATTNLRLISKAASNDNADAASAGFCFFGSDSGITFGVNPTGTRTLLSAATYSLGQWFNVVGLVERGVSQRTYNNGVQYNTASAPVGSVSGTTSLAIGSNVNANLWWTGEISCVLMYNRALTATEIKQNFDATRGRYGI